MRKILLIVLSINLFTAKGQSSKSIDAGISAGMWNNAQTLSLSVNHNFGLFVKTLKVGYGVRLNTLRENMTQYECDCGKAVFISPSEKYNTSVNLMVQLSYKFVKRYYVGFNIDLGGLRFTSSESYIIDHGPLKKNEVPTYFIRWPDSKTSYNLLLVNTNDIGQLNSEFFVGADLTKKLSAKVGLSHYFTSYSGKFIANAEPVSVKLYHFYNLPFVYIGYRIWAPKSE